MLGKANDKARRQLEVLSGGVRRVVGGGWWRLTEIFVPMWNDSRQGPGDVNVGSTDGNYG